MVSFNGLEEKVSRNFYKRYFVIQFISNVAFNG